MKITKIYTRSGDGGATSLVGGVRAAKSDVRLEAYGTVDELSSHLGLLAAMLQPKGCGHCSLCDTRRYRPEERRHDQQMLQKMQNNLFRIGTQLATDQTKTPLPEVALLAEGAVEEVEKEIDTITAMVPETNGFVLPGGTTEAAQAHVARAVCRRCERHIVALAREAEVGDDVMKYVNRMSDYLFVLAKKLNFCMGKSEILWQKDCR